MSASMDVKYFRSQNSFDQRVADVGEVVVQSAIFLRTRGNVYMATLHSHPRHFSRSNRTPTVQQSCAYHATELGQL